MKPKPDPDDTSISYTRLLVGIACLIAGAAILIILAVAAHE